MESNLYIRSFLMRRYYLEFGGALALYALVLIVSILVLRGNDVAPGAARTLIALTPMLPCGLACWAILRQMRRLDELQLRVQLEALGFAFAATAMLTFGYGFLENVGFPRVSLFVVWPLMGALWMVGLRLAVRRYR
jgi:hypothetical protein